MFVTVLKELTANIADKRFFFNAFLPTLVFTTVLAAVFVNEAEGISHALDLWQARDGTTQLLLAAGALAAIYVGASIVAGQWRAIVDLYSGYGPFRWAARPSRWWHRRQRDRQRAMVDRYVEVYERYPLTGEPAPTALGNALLAADRYGSERYGIETSIMWSRLQPLIPDAVSKTVTDWRASVEFMLVLSLQATLFGIATVPYLAVVNGDERVFMACSLGSLLVAWATYRSATDNAVAYAAHVRSSIDLYRTLLLDQFDVPRPLTIQEERRRWGELAAFLYQNVPLPWRRASAP